MWNLKYDTTEPIYETEIGPGTSQTDGCQERGAEEGRNGRPRLADISHYMCNG